MIFETSFNRDFQAMPRRFDGFCTRTVGYVQKKTEVIDLAFASFNYSLILSGRGTYSSGSITFSVMAPCVITQLPGVQATYGPLPGETWEELYFVLPPEKFQPLEARGLFGENRCGWPIRDLPAVGRALRELFPMLGNPDKADLIDHLAERVIMQTILPGEETTDPASEAVAGLARSMAIRPERSFNFREVARDYGVSYSTFQRRWREVHTEPPGQYLLSLRVSEACRLLAETELGIAAVGERAGFEDPAYFSRVFRQRIGVPPSDYRTTHRLGLG
ncbi:AraC family transcriptional regulator [Pontiellaceae bacterium B12227]|nr:AraC family transcriptional regulator [Pontiellaceae bacterium B12227]